MAVVEVPFDTATFSLENTQVPDYGLDPLYSPSSGLFAGLSSPITNAYERNIHGAITQARSNIKRISKDTDAYRTQLETDLSSIATHIEHEHDKSIASDRVLHHLADVLHEEVDSENNLAADLTSAVYKDESAIAQLIKDTKIINAAEKADLALEQISSYATIARDTANLAADAAEVIPFGSTAAGLIRTGADAANVIAETATTIKRSGVTKTLANVVTNLHTGELSPHELMAQSISVAKDVNELVNELKTIPLRRERRLELSFASASDPTPEVHNSEFYTTYGVEGAPVYYVIRDSRSPYYARVKLDDYGMIYEIIKRVDGSKHMSNGNIILSGSKKRIANKAEMHSVMALCKLFGGFSGLSYNLNTARGVLETLVLLGSVPRESLTKDTYDTFIEYKSGYDHDVVERYDHQEMLTSLEQRRENWKLDNPDRVDLIGRDSRVAGHDQVRDATLKLLFVEGNGYNVLGCSYGPVTRAGDLRVSCIIGGASNTDKAIIQYATQTKAYVTIKDNEDALNSTFVITSDGGLRIDDGDMIFFRVYVKPEMRPRLYIKMHDVGDDFHAEITPDMHHDSVDLRRPYKHRYIEVPEIINAATLTTGTNLWTAYVAPNWTKAD
uniref:VP4 n=1 Tax=viral metagenome TaxID=1070528 RepID=A0A2V0R972_9ZZZZ